MTESASEKKGGFACGYTSLHFKAILSPNLQFCSKIFLFVYFNSQNGFKSLRLYPMFSQMLNPLIDCHYYFHYMCVIAAQFSFLIWQPPLDILSGPHFAHSAPWLVPEEVG